jgi:hypothetical protein
MEGSKIPFEVNKITMSMNLVKFLLSQAKKASLIDATIEGQCLNERILDTSL